MNFQNIIEKKIPEIHLHNLSEDLQQRTIFVGMANYTSSTNPIATSGIGPCLGIGISGGGLSTQWKRYFTYAKSNS